MPKFYENVKSRLNKQDIRGIPRADYDELASSMGIADNDSATTEDIRNAVEYFTNKMLSQITLSEMSTEPNINYIDVVEHDSPAPSDDDCLEHVNETECRILKSDTVNSIAVMGKDMGVILSDSDIESISSNLNNQSEDLSNSIEEIRYAITQFVHYKHREGMRNVSTMLDSVRVTIGECNRSLSNELSEGMSGIANDIAQSNNDFKSSVAKSLKRFSIPS